MNKAVYVDDYELIYYNLNFMTSLAQKLEIKVIQLIPYTSQCQMLQLGLRPSKAENWATWKNTIHDKVYKGKEKIGAHGSHPFLEGAFEDGWFCCQCWMALT